MFAAANNNSISVYNIYTFEAVASFRCASGSMQPTIVCASKL